MRLYYNNPAVNILNQAALRDDHTIADAALIRWLTFFTVLVFAVWVLWRVDLIQGVVRTDPTRLSLVILFIFLCATAHCAFRSAFLSARLREMTAIGARPDALQFSADSHEVRLDARVLPPSPLTEYLAEVARQGSDARIGDLDAVFVERVTGSHETGWFFAQLLVKLGLLGTVIGFIIMLASISGTVSYDAASVPELFSGMTSGMRIALNTTLVGLLGTILLSFQYLMVDRSADALLRAATHFAATRLRRPANGGAGGG